MIEPLYKGGGANILKTNRVSSKLLWKIFYIKWWGICYIFFMNYEYTICIHFPNYVCFNFHTNYRFFSIIEKINILDVNSLKGYFKEHPVPYNTGLIFHSWKGSPVLDIA
jgi:hypothetical protein